MHILNSLTATMDKNDLILLTTNTGFCPSNPRMALMSDRYKESGLVAQIEVQGNEIQPISTTSQGHTKIFVDSVLSFAMLNSVDTEISIKRCARGERYKDNYRVYSLSAQTMWEQSFSNIVLHLPTSASNATKIFTSLLLVCCQGR
jgi:hypothetical protein